METREAGSSDGHGGSGELGGTFPKIFWGKSKESGGRSGGAGSGGHCRGAGSGAGLQLISLYATSNPRGTCGSAGGLDSGEAGGRPGWAVDGGLNFPVNGGLE